MLKTLLKHKSIRKYSKLHISDDSLNSILEAGTRASTTGNMQLYSMIVTKDDAMKKKLLPLHFGQKMVVEAPVVITFCADFNRFNKWCLQRNAETKAYDNFLSFVNAAIDAMLVAQNVAVAAESLNMGICYLGTTIYTADKIIDLFNLPKGVVPITTLVIGFPDENPALTDRLPLESVVHYEHYKDYTKNEIDNFYKEKENLEENKKFVKENNKENLAQVFTDVRYKKEDNEHFSKEILKVLKKQGFMK